MKSNMPVFAVIAALALALPSGAQQLQMEADQITAEFAALDAQRNSSPPVTYGASVRDANGERIQIVVHKDEEHLLIKAGEKLGRIGTGVEGCSLAAIVSNDAEERILRYVDTASGRFWEVNGLKPDGTPKPMVVASQAPADGPMHGPPLPPIDPAMFVPVAATTPPPSAAFTVRVHQPRPSATLFDSRLTAQR